MLGRESPQRSLFGAHLSVKHLLTPRSFYEVLSREADRLLSDEDFAACYDLTTGRPSVPPSRMAKQLLESGAEIPVRRSAWYAKELPTFADTLALVRQHLRALRIIRTSREEADLVLISRTLLDRMTETLAYAA